MTAFTIDGLSFDVSVTSIKRTFNVVDSENTQRNLDGDMSRDVIGSYVGYSIEIDSKNISKSDYDRLFEIISAPTDFHDLVMPYGQSVYSFKAYISNGGDVLRRMGDDHNIWSGLSFNIIAKSPQRRPL